MRFLVEGGNAAVGVEGGVIAPLRGRRSEYDVVLSVPDAEVRPGLINAHDHLHRNHYGRLGRPPYANAYDWGHDIHRIYSPAITAGRSIPRRDALLTGAWKNLVAGVTTVVHHDPWDAELDVDFPIRVARVRSPHSLRLEPPESPAWHGMGPMAVHLAEGVDQAAAREVRELDARGLLGPGLLAVHVVGADADGIRRLRASGSAIVWCPSSNLFLFGATAPAALLAPGIDVLLGTDSLLTNGPDAGGAPAGTLLDELRAARALGMLDDDRLADAVGALAARCLGLAAPSLAPGAPADLVLLRNPLLSATVADVAMVMVSGVPRVADPALAAPLRHALGAGRCVSLFGVDRWVYDGAIS